MIGTSISGQTSNEAAAADGRGIINPRINFNVYEEVRETADENRDLEYLHATAVLYGLDRYYVPAYSPLLDILYYNVDVAVAR